MTDLSSIPGGQDGYDCGKKSDLGRLEIIGHLAAGVAHELNNLLFVISGFSELARLDLPDKDPAAAKLDRIEEAVDRAKDLTRMVLESAHPSDKGSSPPIQLYPLVKEGIKLVRESLSDKVRIHQEITTDAAEVAVDPVRFFPVVMMLLKMAAVPLAVDGGRLWVLLTTAKAGETTARSSLMLTVCSVTGDSGDEVWRQFRRGGGVPTFPLPEGESTTASINEIVRDCGGELRFRSIDQRGLCIELLLPLASNEAIW